MNIWDRCKGHQQISTLKVKPWRVIEAQHILSTRSLVDTREEHEILEDLIESSKPAIEKNTDYLIFTPFRYPPLKCGSRFGQTYERSLFYGSLKLKTAFYEVSFYRMKFLSDSDADLGYIEISLTAFQTLIQTKQGIFLTKPPFATFKKNISNRNDYTDSQKLGSLMREAKVEAFLYFSARTAENEINIGAFSPDVFKKTKGSFFLSQQTWQCIANRDSVEFIRKDVSDQRTRYVIQKEWVF